MPIMLVTTGPQRGRVIRWLRGDAQLIGRGKRATIRLKDPKLAPKHAEIVQKAGQWFVRDVGSESGTFVNLIRAKDFVRLCDGDQIIVGDSVLAYCSAAGVDDLPSPAEQVDVSDKGSESSAEWSAKPPAAAAIDEVAEPTGPEDADAGFLAALNDVTPWDYDDASSLDDAEAGKGDAGAAAGDAASEQAAGMGDPAAAASDGPEEAFDIWSEALGSAMGRPGDDGEQV